MANISAAQFVPYLGRDGSHLIFLLLSLVVMEPNDERLHFLFYFNLIKYIIGA